MDDIDPDNVTVTTFRSPLAVAFGVMSGLAFRLLVDAAVATGLLWVAVNAAAAIAGGDWRLGGDDALVAGTVCASLLVVARLYSALSARR